MEKNTFDMMMFARIPEELQEALHVILASSFRMGAAFFHAAQDSEENLEIFHKYKETKQWEYPMRSSIELENDDDIAGYQATCKMLENTLKTEEFHSAFNRLANENFKDLLIMAAEFQNMTNNVITKLEAEEAGNVN